MKIENHLLYNDFKNVRHQIDAEMLSHPRFMELLEHVCLQTDAYLENVYSHGVYVSPDGKKVKFIVECVHKETEEEKLTSTEKANELVPNEKEISATEISIDEGMLKITTARGKLRSVKESDMDKYVLYSKKPRSLLSTYYANNVYDENGICLSWGSYTDELEFYKGMEDIDIRVQTLDPAMNAAVFDEHSYPQTCVSNNAIAENLYRTHDNLGISYKKNEEGIKGVGEKTIQKETKSVFMVGLETPENLRTVGTIATWSPEEEQFDLEEEFQDRTYDEVLEDIKENFERVVASKMTENNQELYQAMLYASKKSKSK